VEIKWNFTADSP